MKTLPRIAPLVMVGMCLAGASQASKTYTWNFDTPTGTTGTTHSYLDTQSQYTITAGGFTTANAPGTPNIGDTWNTGTVTAKQLYGKQTAGDPTETGLGLDGTPDNEIQVQTFTQLNVSNLKANGLTSLSMTISSIQQGEGYYLWGSNTSGTAGKLLASYLNSSSAAANVTQTLLVPGYNTYNFFAVSATGGDVLIANGLTAVAASTPEPGALALFAVLSVSGLGTLTHRLRRRK